MSERPPLMIISLGGVLALAVGLALQTDARPAAAARMVRPEGPARPASTTALGAPPAAVATGSTTPELAEHRARAQARILGAGAELEDRTGAVHASPVAQATGRANGNALGTFVAIENETALQSFHTALGKLEAGTLAGEKLRILAYGASHTQGDVYTSYLRYYLQSRFGDGGLGFVQMAKLDKSYHTLALRIDSRGFAVHHAQNNAGGAHGWFGLLGASATASSSAAHADIFQGAARRQALGAVTLDVYAMGQHDSGGLALSIDTQERATWPTSREQPKLVVHSESAASGFSSVSVKPKGDGRVQLFGISVERPGPGVVLDTLGISGTRAANWLKWDESSWADQVKLRNPYLVTLAYGTNETMDKNQPITRYEQDLDLVLKRLRRAAPQASCLLIGPGDVSKKVRGAWIRPSRLARVIEVQRRQAIAHGCGFWDTMAFMGDGGIARWVSAKPAMASGDHVHLTRRGYVKLGMGIGDALLRAYDAQAPSPRVSAVR